SYAVNPPAGRTSDLSGHAASWSALGDRPPPAQRRAESRKPAQHQRPGRRLRRRQRREGRGVVAVAERVDEDAEVVTAAVVGEEFLGTHERDRHGTQGVRTVVAKQARTMEVEEADRRGEELAQPVEAGPEIGDRVDGGIEVDR